MADSPDWLRLQRKIFSRWVNQKLSVSRGLNVEDIVTELASGVVLINLVEVLSETEFQGKYNKTPKMRVHKIDNCNRALAYTKEQGVSMKIPPQAEDLVDGDERRCLGLVWATMLKFMKFGDADDSLNAKDALMMWVQNKTAGYEGVTVKDFKGSMKDGVAMGAVIHKHRPQMIDMSQLQPGKEHAIANWNIVQEAALRYFNLEKYITPEDIQKLDENSMVVYVSEYYYGIAEQRKLDLAARRIAKLVDFTKVNDQLRAQYNQKAEELTTLVAKVSQMLNDRTIDNTMAGAKQKIADFYAYKANDKSTILGDQLNMEGVYNNLAMRLSHHKRPQFQPAPGCDLQSINTTLANLEKTEAERKVALHAELNRQIRLLDLDRQHKEASEQLVQYQAGTQTYLNTKEVSHSVAAAQYQLAKLDASDLERTNVEETTWAATQKIGAELIAEKYERSNEVEAREAAIRDSFASLSAASKAKRPILDDDLKREEFREDLRLKFEQHAAKHSKIVAWFNDREAYLSAKETVDSIADANLQLGLLAAYAAEKKAQTVGGAEPLTSLGADILSAKYEGISTYQLGDEPDTAKPAHVQDRESDIDSKWARLDELYAAKKAILDDDLARETFRENLRVQGLQHNRAFQAIEAWGAESKAYLAVREDIDDIPKAKTALSILAGWRTDLSAQADNAVAPLKALGEQILAAKYETEHSSYTYGSADSDSQSPDDITGRHSSVDSLWNDLGAAADEKNTWLDSELDREEKKEANRVAFATLAQNFIRFTTDRAQESKSTHFGFTLAEVEAYDATLSAADAAIQESKAKQEQAYRENFEVGEALGVKENAYTDAAPSSLDAAGDELSGALAARRERYNTELERQRYLDGLCKAFADLADPFNGNLVATKEKITTSQDELEDQLEFVKQRIAESEASDAATLAKIDAAQQKLDDEGVTNNIHTTLTGKDVQVQHQQYVMFLNRKQTMLEEAIEHKRLRGLTPSDFQEIEENFSQFDTNNDQLLSTKELKACLYSLGEEKGPKEIAAIVEEFGDGSGNITHDNFVEFMIKTLGDSDTKDEILYGFKLINRGNDTLTEVEKMELVMEAKDVQYIQENAPAEDGHYNYVSWTEDVFSR